MTREKSEIIFRNAKFMIAIFDFSARKMSCPLKQSRVGTWRWKKKTGETWWREKWKDRENALEYYSHSKITWLYISLGLRSNGQILNRILQQLYSVESIISFYKNDYSFSLTLSFFYKNEQKIEYYRSRTKSKGIICRK